VNRATLPEAAANELLERRQKFVAFVQKQINSPADAEDIVQSAFIRLVENADTINAKESIVAWFYRVLRNAIVDYYRRRGVRDRRDEELAREMRELESRLEYDPAAKNRVCQCLWPVVEKLKPEYRDALKVVDIEERSLRELAERFGISGNNAAVRVHRAREALRKQVLITCGACATHGCVDCRCHSNVEISI
jgi:RNA polymerase sigma-70 factor (ECF subfamily)